MDRDFNARQAESDREVNKVTEILTLQKLRQAAARPLLAEVVAVQNGRVEVTFKPRRVVPSGKDGKASLPSFNFYQPCEESECTLPLLPDELYQRRRPEYLKRVEPKVGMRVKLSWAFNNHPLGWRAPENWLAVVTTETETTASAEDSKGVVESVRTAGDGTALVTVKLDDGRAVTISALLTDAPAKGARGTLSFEGEDQKFTPDEPK